MPADRLPQLIDPAATYRDMGLLAATGNLGFIGSARVFAGAQSDSLVLALGLSLSARGLTFRREADAFLAEYRVETALRRGSALVAQAARDQRVRVGTFRETQRADESIIFQEFLNVPPGDFTLTVTVRDRNGPNSGRVEQTFNVPVLTPPAISLPLTVYEAQSRTTTATPPVLVMNPRQSVQYGSDTLHFYVETYRLPPGDRLIAAAVDGLGRTGWQDTIRISEVAPVRGTLLSIPPAVLSIGRYELQIQRGDTVMAEAPFLVTFSDQYAVANLDDIVSLLRYFPDIDTLRTILRMPAEERSTAWQRFWRRSDPVPATPENEAIDDYLARVRAANERIRDEGMPGWLTERGEVLIRLGEPNDMLDRRPDQGRGRIITWNYFEYRLTLTFVDDAGFGRFRLDPRSRAEFARVINRLTGR